jgi:hypothetical protein
LKSSWEKSIVLRDWEVSVFWAFINMLFKITYGKPGDPVSSGFYLLLIDQEQTRTLLSLKIAFTLNTSVVWHYKIIILFFCCCCISQIVTTGTRSWKKKVHKKKEKIFEKKNCRWESLFLIAHSRLCFYIGNHKSLMMHMQ